MELFLPLARSRSLWYGIDLQIVAPIASSLDGPNLYKSMCSLHHRVPDLGKFLPTINYLGDTHGRLGS